MWELTLSDVLSSGNLTSRRALRLLQIIRVVGAVRKTKIFKFLRLYVDQVFGDIVCLLWRLCIFFVRLFVLGMAFQQAATDYWIGITLQTLLGRKW